ncbi:MAG TPA: response regulator [Nitrososphaera sp.]|nr:response regulator [Nitrososphaera sp.]
MQVLIIDDDIDITETLGDYFRERGEICRVYNKGAEGLKAMGSDPFDVALLDLSMPGINGFDSLKALAYKGILRKRTVFVITAMDISPESEKLMREAGVVEIIRKPFSIEYLTKTLEKYTNSAATSSKDSKGDNNK